ncbi:MAG TPA: DUF397 domain-containing protein [Pseudonocardiaceae bacterium]|jgi:hypothetical protein|nr:DUF397 domain-containing protein [Pseudonocardiaceae bacterium]
MKRDPTPARFVKSTYSQAATNCVEVASLGDGRAVRDSKNPTGAVLRFTAAQWSAFTAGIGAGEFH